MSSTEIGPLCEREWGLQITGDVSCLEPEPGSAGLYRVKARDGPFLLTVHRIDRTVSDLERATEAAAFLAHRGLPTPTYRSTRDGTPAASIDGHLYTLRAWVPGDPMAREALSEEQMLVLGRGLGWCHRLMAELPQDEIVAWPSRVSGAMEEIDSTQNIIASRPPAQADSQVLEVLASRRALLEEAPDLAGVFAPYPTQVIHGDYHVLNAIVDVDGKLSGVIDLDALPGYPAWEVHYAIWWSLRAWDISAFDMTLAQHFVAGYLEEARLTPEELLAGPVMLYWWLLMASWDARRYAEDPTDADALGGVLWFHRLAGWLDDHGRPLGKELASLTRSG